MIVFDVRGWYCVIVRPQAQLVTFLFAGRYRVPINRVTAGNWALIEGVRLLFVVCFVS